MVVAVFCAKSTQKRIQKMNSSENHETATSIANSDRLQLDELREQELQINREQQGFSLCNRAFILRAMALLLGPLLSSIFMFDILQPGKPEISRTAAVTIWVAVVCLFLFVTNM